MSIQLENFEEVMELLDSIAESGRLEEALSKACALVEREAKKKAPKDTGALRRSITSKVENDKGIIFTPLEYAPYIEYGTGLFAEEGGRESEWCYFDDEGNFIRTRGQPPQPFMRPALNESREEIVRILKEGFLSD